VEHWINADAPTAVFIPLVSAVKAFHPTAVHPDDAVVRLLRAWYPTAVWLELVVTDWRAWLPTAVMLVAVVTAVAAL